jgi:hypothetical protein
MVWFPVPTSRRARPQCFDSTRSSSIASSSRRASPVTPKKRYIDILRNLRACAYNSLTSEVPTRAHKRKRTRDDDLQSDPCLRWNPVLTTSTVPAPTNPKRARIGDNVVKPIRHPRPFYWEGNVGGISRLALISESLRPLPSVPDEELKNDVVTRTISENEHLFDIVTPINIDRLASLLVNHPNPPFVSSVLRGLREGFWPWADTQHNIQPQTISSRANTKKILNAFYAIQRSV